MPVRSRRPVPLKGRQIFSHRPDDQEFDQEYDQDKFDDDDDDNEYDDDEYGQDSFIYYTGSGQVETRTIRQGPSRRVLTGLLLVAAAVCVGWIWTRLGGIEGSSDLHSPECYIQIQEPLVRGGKLHADANLKLLLPFSIQKGTRLDAPNMDTTTPYEALMDHCETVENICSGMESLRHNLKKPRYPLNEAGYCSLIRQSCDVARANMEIFHSYHGIRPKIKEPFLSKIADEMKLVLKDPDLKRGNHDHDHRQAYKQFKGVLLDIFNLDLNSTRPLPWRGLTAESRRVPALNPILKTKAVVQAIRRVVPDIVRETNYLKKHWNYEYRQAKKGSFANNRLALDAFHYLIQEPGGEYAFPGSSWLITLAAISGEANRLVNDALQETGQLEMLLDSILDTLRIPGFVLRHKVLFTRLKRTMPSSLWAKLAALVSFLDRAESACIPDAPVNVYNRVDGAAHEVRDKLQSARGQLLLYEKKLKTDKRKARGNRATGGLPGSEKKGFFQTIQNYIYGEWGLEKGKGKVGFF